MHQPREGGGGGEGTQAAVLPDGKVLVAGGFYVRTGQLSFDSANYLSSAELFDPVRRTWTQTASMHQSRFGQALVTLSTGKVLAAGGFGGSQEGFRSSAELYDPVTGTWSYTAAMAQCRSNPGVATIDPLPGNKATTPPATRVLFAGGDGCDGSSQKSAEIYDAKRGTWTPAAEMHDPRWGFVAVALPDGRVLVAGGFDGKGTKGEILASAEIYNPKTNQWSATAPMHEPRFQYSAGLLANGDVIVAGGKRAPGVDTASAEVFNPAKGTWSVLPSMRAPRSESASIVLPATDGRRGGRFLVAGGGQQVSVEVYDTATASWSQTDSLSDLRDDAELTLLPSGTALIVGGYQKAAGSYTDTATTEIYDPTARAS